MPEPTPSPPRDRAALAPIERQADPWVWCIVIPALFAWLASIRLTIPGAPFFDEVHYLPAARELLEIGTSGGGHYINREHPLFGKAMIALGIAILGDNPLGWRVPSLIAGTVMIGAAMRALWLASEERIATILFGILLVTGFPVLVHARIAMLDIFMAAFLALAAWQFAAACREPERARWKLALCGIALGMAMGSKWNAAALAILPGLTFFAARFAAGRRRLLFSRRGAPIPGITLAEAFVWLGFVPIVVYSLTFAPGYWLTAPDGISPIGKEGFIGFHSRILELQGSVMKPHNYQSVWPQWITNTRGIWYLYEFVDGAQRGVLLIGNPLTMLAGLPALLWCLGVGAYRGDWARLGVAVGYGVAIGFWMIAPKPVQFFYHYLMPSTFLLGALALALADCARSQTARWLAFAMPLASIAMFFVFFPIMTAAELEGPESFAKWTWLVGWR